MTISSALTSKPVAVVAIVPRQMQRQNLRAALFRHGQVVEVERVPRVDRTPEVALAEMNARALLNAVDVRPDDRLGLVVRILERVVPVRIEPDRELERSEPVFPARGFGGVVEQLRPLRPLTGRHALDLHHPADLRIMGLQHVVRDFRRPAGGEGIAFCFNGNIGVDQRSAADPRALDDRHVREHPQVEPAVPLFRSFRIEHPVVRRLPREVLHLPLASALEHDHRGARLREAACRDRPAEPRTDDDDVCVGHGGYTERKPPYTSVSLPRNRPVNFVSAPVRAARFGPSVLKVVSCARKSRKWIVMIPIAF